MARYDLASLVAFTLVQSTASLASAQPATGQLPPEAAAPAPAPAPAPGLPPEITPARDVSLTISPVHLILPIVELTAELRISDRVGIAAIGGYGSVTVESYSVSGDDRSAALPAYELGGQVAYYPLDPFRGLHLGAELVYLRLAGDIGSARVRATGEGLAVGPLIGYKLMTSGGFTFVAQGGAEHVTARAQASDTAGGHAEADDKSWIPLINLNLGWSF